ncbi:MAG: uroporphyrinogen-III C-methyltransferase [Gammaproteobacteria bacterium]|nr:uroporphyrinogen-III C-methyltransferase [Gammaproteobacteria bacterium]
MSTKGDMEPKTTTAPTKPAANTNKQKSGSALLGVFVFLTFLLAVAGIGAGYYVWQQMQQQFQAAEVERKALEHALGTLDQNPRIQKFSRNFNKKIEDTNSNIEKISKNIKSLDGEQQRLASVVEKTSDIIGRGQNGWMLKEVEHVLRMSQHRLLLDRDFDGAIAGLKSADQRLNDIHDVRLIPIRKSIAKQTQTLNQFPHPDYTGIQLQLDNTIASLKNGLLKQATVQTANKQASNSSIAPKENENPTDNKPFDAEKFLALGKQFALDILEKTKAAFSDSINVTHGEQKIALFIEEQEKKRAYDFLRNKLLGAKYSVSTRDDSAFHQQLNAARAWLNNNDHFTNQASLTKEIDQLNKNDLMPELPDISEPSTLLAKHMNSIKDKK